MERLQKFLAGAGVASRRKCEELIAAGRVRVNGQVVSTPGCRVSAADQVCLDGKPVKKALFHTYYLLNKPAGHVTTLADTHERPTVMELVPPKPRVFPVGRLDLDTTGVLLMTDDGELANALLHPSREVDKTYRAVVRGRVSDDSLNRLAAGIPLEEGITSPARVEVLSRSPRLTVLALTLHQGWKRQVKRMLLAVGHRVIQLERTGFAFLTTAGLKPGEYRPLQPEEVRRLKKVSPKGGTPARK